MRSLLWLIAAAPLFGACAATSDGDGSNVQSDELATFSSDAGSDADADAASSSDDGTPVRRACTSSFGSGLTTGSFGRLDGYLVSIVQPNAHMCSADAHHIHLQVLMNNAVYDVAANVANDVEMSEADHAPIGAAWSEGWHPEAKLDYVTNLGLHEDAFSTQSQTTLATKINGALTTANHVSIYATKYAKSGTHLVHRNGRNNDGAIVLNPLSANPRYITFHFANQHF